MPVWTYSARTVAGDLKRAEYDAASRDEVIAHLRSQRLIPIAIREKPKGIQLPGGQKVKTRDIVILTRQFATMINAGLPLVQALDILAKQSDNKYKNWLWEFKKRDTTNRLERKVMERDDWKELLPLCKDLHNQCKAQFDAASANSEAAAVESVESEAGDNDSVPF